MWLAVKKNGPPHLAISLCPGAGSELRAARARDDAIGIRADERHTALRRRPQRLPRAIERVHGAGRKNDLRFFGRRGEIQAQLEEPRHVIRRTEVKTSRR